MHYFSTISKRFLFVVLTLVLATHHVHAASVDRKTAQKAAENFLKSKLNTTPDICLISFPEKASFSHFYVFGNEQCFVIIAADNCVHPVLGYSLENAFGTETMPENIASWFEVYEDEVAQAANSKMEASADIQAEWTNLLNGNGLTPKTRTTVAPLVRTTWNQTAPYNDLCPIEPENDSSWYNGHVPTGCMATAMAQIMNYWEHPVRGVGSHSYIPQKHPEYGVQYADFGATVYDWDNMKNSYSNGYTEEEALAVAILMYHCGVSVNMNYTPGGSSGGYSTEPFITYFNYNPGMYKVSKSYIMGETVYDFYSNEEWAAMLKTELDLDRPLCYLGGHYINDEENGSHAFVCDGYDENDYFHFNWGWGGSSDGYYLIGALNVGENISQQYNHYNAFFANFYPCETSINPPTHVRTTVSGRNVSIQWNSVENAASYKLYRDGDLIANNITDTSYSDNNLLYGTYSYYLKSVMADGTMSLRSDLSIAEVAFPGPVPTNLQATVNGRDVSLTWEEPVSENVNLNYGEGSAHYSWPASITYYAHRYQAVDLVQYLGKRVNKIETYISNPGTYTVYVYISPALMDKPDINSLAFESNPMSFGSVGWHEILLDTPVILSENCDLWVVIKQEDTGVNFPIPSFNLQEYNANACYRGFSSPTELSPTSTNYSISWFINTCLTDGTYTYNLYRNNAIIANEIAGASYQDNNLPDDYYSYFVTTNYYGGESAASNEVAFMIGNPHYTITTTASPVDEGSVSGGGTFEYGQISTVTASANPDFIFLNWTEEDAEVSTEASYSFAVGSNRNLTAHFVPQSYSVSVLSSGEGSVSGGGTYDFRQVCTLTAIPNSGSIFTNWSKDGVLVSTEATYNFTVTETATYTAHFTQAQSGLLNGLFSVDNSTQVQFSQGNLRYQASSDTWCFADHQWDFVGAHNANISSTYSGWIDLFGWGTSGFDHGAACYQPWSTSTENDQYYAYGNTIYNLYDETGQADWGANPILNGGNTPNQWRTLTTQEWQYLFNTRSGIRFAKAVVNDICGVVLLPDGWDESVYALNNPNEGSEPYTSNVIGAEDWSSMETAGAVFLPATGIRGGNTITHIGFYCGYWTSSRFNNNSNCAFCVHIYSDYVSPNSFHYRNNGYAVRLVSDYSAPSQTSDFLQGWNWWSAYINVDGYNSLAMLEEALGTNAMQIKSQSDFAQYLDIPGYGGYWYGTLDTILSNKKTYLIQNSTSCQIELTGMPVSPADHPITILPGWNWIGFPSSTAISFAEAFAGFTPTDGDQVKSQSGFSQYMFVPGYGGVWYGGLETENLTPGMGLMYKSMNTGNATLVYPTVGRSVENVSYVEKHWTNDVHAYPSNMTLMAVVELDDVELASDNYELAAFADGECRGSAKLTYVEPLNRYFAFLTIAGEEAADLTFGLYNHTSGEESFESSDVLVYTTDASVGSFNTPMVVRFRGTTGLNDLESSLHVYPNPVACGQRFSIGLDDVASQPVRVEIVNALGVTVAVETSTKMPASIVAPNTAGVYIVRITVEGKGVLVRRLIVE